MMDLNIKQNQLNYDFQRNKKFTQRLNDMCVEVYCYISYQLCIRCALLKFWKQMLVNKATSIKRGIDCASAVYQYGTWAVILGNWMVFVF